MIHRQNLVTRKEVAGTLIWYILPERGDKSLGKHRALSPLESSGSLGVGCVYQAIPSEVKHMLLYPVCPTTKKEVRHVGGLSGLQNQHPAHWNVLLWSIYCWYQRLPGVHRAQTKTRNAASSRNWQQKRNGALLRKLTNSSPKKYVLAHDWVLE